MPHATDEASTKTDQLAGSVPTGLSDTERDRIRWRAHALWREDGCPQGRDREYWERAELEILKGRRSF